MPAWEELVRQLLEDIRDTTTVLKLCGEVPYIHKSEVQYAIQMPKNNKSPGHDEIYPEVLKLITSENLNLSVQNL